MFCNYFRYTHIHIEIQIHTHTHTHSLSLSLKSFQVQLKPLPQSHFLPSLDEILSLILGLSLHLVKNLPAMQELQEMQIRSLGQEDPLEAEMATHSRILGWEIARAEEP